LSVLDTGHGQENTRSGAVGESCKGLGSERSGACMLEVRNLHKRVEREEGVNDGIHWGWGLRMVRRKGSVLDRSATMVLMNK
jgi:hypothetical protein